MIEIVIRMKSNNNPAEEYSWSFLGEVTPSQVEKIKASVETIKDAANQQLEATTSKIDSADTNDELEERPPFQRGAHYGWGAPDDAEG